MLINVMLIKKNKKTCTIGKIKSVCFSNQALSLVQSYLCNRFQRSIINASFSSWNEVITVIPQGSILGPFLFNIFLNDIFLFISKCQLCNYADVIILHKCFHQNHMVLNPGKCHYMVIGDDDPSHKVILNNNEISNSNEEKLLGILLDSKLNFESYIISLCKKAGQELSALARINC